MIDIIYAEQDALQYDRAQRILSQFPRAHVVKCDHHGEVFNRSAQNFRLQKNRPALILAVKNGEKVLPAPVEYSVGGSRNFYFSHMLNCLYDCRYCFLQGIYRSANYLLFVNFEDFVESIRCTAAEYPQDNVWFFSGYDCDSLAFEPVTRFAEYFIPAFESLSNACLELRTKSTQIRSLLAYPALPNVVVAFSFTTESASRDLEHKVPQLSRRIEALAALQKRGWSVALRFDPLIYEENFSRTFESLCRQIFARVDARNIHSITLGSFRLPREFFKRMKKLYPKEKLFARFLSDGNGTISYRTEIEAELLDSAREVLCEHVSARLIYRMRAD